MVESRIGGSTVKRTMDALGVLGAPERGRAIHVDWVKMETSGALEEASKCRGVASEFAAKVTVEGVSECLGVDAVAVASGTVGFGGGMLEKFAGIARSVRVPWGGKMWMETTSHLWDCVLPCKTAL